MWTYYTRERDERDVDRLKEGRETRKARKTDLFSSIFSCSLGHRITDDNIFAVVQGVRRELNRNVTAHSDSRKMGQPYVLSP